MYCVFNATTTYDADQGNPLGWPFDSQYGYFCDQRDRSLFMLSNGLVNMIAIVAAYLFVVLYLGPKFMENRKPLEIKTIIRLYNFADFLDTIWFVLRKKHSHISFLHVFHHSYVPTVAYVATRWIPVSPNAMSLPFINSAIHVVMYTYYLMATYPALRPHLWWKRYLTGLQMTQFVTVLIYNIFGFFFFGRYCGKTQTPALMGSLISAAIFLILFYSFYQKAYVQPNAKTNSCGQAMTSTTTTTMMTIPPNSNQQQNYHYQNHLLYQQRQQQSLLSQQELARKEL